LIKEEALVEFETFRNEQSNYGVQINGYFRAARAGEYRLYVSCKGECEVYMQEAANVMEQATMRLVASAKDTERRERREYFEQST